MGTTSLTRLTLLILLCAGLAYCGQKGGLTRPEESANFSVVR